MTLGKTNRDEHTSINFLALYQLHDAAAAADNDDSGDDDVDDDCNPLVTFTAGLHAVFIVWSW